MNFFSKKKLVSTKGIAVFNESITYRSWFTVECCKLFGTWNEIINEKNLNLNCSCENVLWAIGALISVVLDVFVGLNANEGFRVELLFCFCVYHNQVINK